MTTSINQVGIVGCGTMGAGIAEIVARNGHEVRFVEVDDAAVEAGFARIRRSLERQVNRERLTQTQADEIAGRIDGSADWAVLAEADLVVEAVPEKLALKQAAFERIDAVVGPDTIIATNTSSLPVMDIAVHASRPNRVLGFHFFNPAPVMKLIELVRTVVTDEAVVADARAFAESIGKSPVVVGDRRGFIANQLLFPYLNQAVQMVEEGYATKEDIDNAMRFGAGLPMGPLALVDLVGLDTMVGIMDAIHSQFDDPRFAPRPILKQLVAAGYKGRKTGRGFYTYQRPGSSRVVADDTASAPADPGLVAAWSTVGVVGTGTMASGIAEVCAKAGYDVVVRGRSREKAAAVRDRVGASMQRMVDKERMTADQRSVALDHIIPTADFADMADCDVVVEAVAEDLDIKRGIFTELAVVLGDDTVITTTTSSLPIIECAMVTDRPERVVGLHFFNPAAIMKLVEVVPTVRTHPDVIAMARGFVAHLGKVEVLAGDRAGFIVNALLFPYLNDSIKMLASHYATAEEVDTAMKLGCGYPMGPFELLDVVGLDVSLAITQRLHDEFHEPSFSPAPLLAHMVEAGFSGRKAGRGFYIHG